MAQTTLSLLFAVTLGITGHVQDVIVSDVGVGIVTDIPIAFAVGDFAYHMMANRLWHEFGHLEQENTLSIAYLPTVGLLSIGHLILARLGIVSPTYAFDSWPEDQANNLGRKYATLRTTR